MCQPGYRPLRERHVPRTPAASVQSQARASTCFPSILQWTPCAHHSSLYESTVHGRPCSQVSPRMLAAALGPPIPGYSRLVPLGPALPKGALRVLSLWFCHSPHPPFPDGPKGLVLTATQHHSTGLHRTTAMPATLEPSLLMTRRLGTDGVHTLDTPEWRAAGLHPVPSHPSQPCSGCEV